MNYKTKYNNFKKINTVQKDMTNKKVIRSKREIYSWEQGKRRWIGLKSKKNQCLQ